MFEKRKYLVTALSTLILVGCQSTPPMTPVQNVQAPILNQQMLAPSRMVSNTVKKTTPKLKKSTKVTKITKTKVKPTLSSSLKTKVNKAPVTKIKSKAKLNPTPSAPATLKETKKLEVSSEVLEAIKRQRRFRKEAIANPNAVNEVKLNMVELAAVKAFISKNNKSDEDFQPEKDGFSTKSADAGNDVSVGQLLYDAKYIRSAEWWGIETANDFLMAGRSPFRRWTLGFKLEGFFKPSWFKPQLLFWLSQADLLRVSGVSREDSFLLAANGVTSVPDLARRNNIIDRGLLKVNMAITAALEGFPIPKMDEIEAWTNEATTLEPVIF